MNIWNDYKKDMDAAEPSKEAIARCKAETQNRLAKQKRTVLYRRAPVFACAAALLVAASLALSFLFGAGGFAPAGNNAGNLVRQIKSYGELYQALHTYAPRSGGYITDSIPMGMDALETQNAAIPAETPDYSETNLQVAGVQEADIVKTDGAYIYAVSGTNAYIVKAENGGLTLVSTIQLPDDGKKPGGIFYNLNAQNCTIYVTPSRLVVMMHDTVKPFAETSETEKESSDDPSSAQRVFYGENVSSVALIYDITDKANPSLINSVGQDGCNVTSRMVGDVLYLVSRYCLFETPDESDPRTFVPATYQNGKPALLLPERITLCPLDGYAAYLVIGGYDTIKGEMVSAAASMGNVSAVYANTENLYIAGTASETKIEGDYAVYQQRTLIQRFALDAGNVVYAASGTVDGCLLNQFSLDERNGFLRVVTTVTRYSHYRHAYDDYDDEEYAVTSAEDEPAAAPDSSGMSDSSGGGSVPSVSNGQTNAVYVLNSDLFVVGAIEGLARDERVYSVRFDGDIGYFVTFRQIDPLFAVDLSDPKTPKILSALKIPGFSDYLHPFDDGLLFGLGRDADENGSTTTLKLSMFDVSDPVNVREADKTAVEGAYYSQASYNHKAILINGEKNIIAFPTEYAYMVYAYAREEGFKLQTSISLEIIPGESAAYPYAEMRGLYIGGYLYLFTRHPGGDNTGTILAYDMDGYTPVSAIGLH